MVSTSEQKAFGMSEQLRRQRRNLMFFSTLIIFMRYAELEIKKAGLLGVEVVIGNIYVFYLFVWVLFFYFFLRYYQYYREEPLKGISDAFWEKLNKIAQEKLLDLVENEYPEVKKQPQYGGPSWQRSKKDGILRRKIQVYVNKDRYGTDKTVEYSVSILPFLPHRIYSFIHVIIQRSHFTDYVLPFILSLITFIIGINGNWDGSLLNTIAGLKR